MESVFEVVGVQVQIEGEFIGLVEVQIEGEICSELLLIFFVFGLKIFDEIIEDMKFRIKFVIEGLVVFGEYLSRYFELLKVDRVIVEVEKIVQLLEGSCLEIGCIG